MSDGIDQRQRLPAAWARGGFKVDEMSLDQRIEVCARLAEHLRFVDHHNHEDGTWGRWFEADESFVLARIAAVDRYALQQSFLKEVDSASPEKLAGRVFELAWLVDGWLQALSSAEVRPPGPELHSAAPRPAIVVRELIGQLVRPQLGGRLVWILENREHLGLAATSPQLPGRRGELHPLWFESPAEPSIDPDQPPRLQLRGIFFSFLTAIDQMRKLARAHLADSLATRRHEPAAGLLLAFLRVYEKVQFEINRFTDRHIDFYYHDVLGLKPRGATPDHVHVVCVPDVSAQPEQVLPGGTAFVAGKDLAGQPLHFRSERPFALGDARVAALCTLRLQRDEKISPEADLGYVTGIKAHRLGERAAGAAAVPLFGGGPGSREAALGIVVATPLLMLQQGRREIDLNLRLSWPGATQNQLLAAALAARSDKLRPALGALFACWMLSDDEALTDMQREQLRGHAIREGLEIEEPASGLGSPLFLMCGRRAVADGQREYRPRDLAFHQYMNELFEVQLTHAQGWFAAERIQIGRPPREQAGAGGLRLTIFLRPEDPAIVGCDPQVHGPQWPTRLPLLRLQASPRARIHPYSLFERARLLEAEVRVHARDVRDLLLQNNQGPLDGTKAFSPFGPLPGATSYLLFGSPEAARKNLTSLTLHIEWGVLPQEPGGFASHYAGHAPELAEGRFTAALAILRDGQWQPCGGASADQPLFGQPDAQGRLPAGQDITVHEESVRQFARASEVPLAIGPTTRDGVMRLSLKQPRSAFGHAAYPALLSSTLSAQARRRRPLALPNAPYTPVIERISLDYRAATRLSPGTVRRRDDSPDNERLLHIHPFGVAELEPDAQLRHHGLLPRLEPDGSLCIGLQAERLEGPLGLLFQLRPDEAAARTSTDPADAVRWFHLQGNHWRALTARHLQSDSTQGMLTSGIVQLDLPVGASRDNTVLDAGLFWLRLSRSSGLEAAPPLVAVHAQALTLVRETGAAGAADAPLPGGRIRQTAVPQAGLAGVLQPEPSFGWQPAEDQHRLRVRAGERLRHKNRASLAWDVERLVLESFPEVFKVKCLAPPAAGLGRGQARVVVVPHVRVHGPQDSTRAQRLDARTLQRIKSFLAERCSPFAHLHVCDPSYERVLVRCRVQLDPSAQPGAVLRRVNRTLVEFLSPWHEVGPGARFGWVLRCDEVQAVVRAVPGVGAVGQLSLLRLADAGSGRYELTDTALAKEPDAAAAAGAHAQGPAVGPAEREPDADLDLARDLDQGREPQPVSDRTWLVHGTAWSLALPMPEHLVSVVGSLVGDHGNATGLSRLAVGRQLVVAGGAP